MPVPLALLLVLRAKPRSIFLFAGLPLIIAGECLRVWALRHIGPTTRTREICADLIVTSGPYRFSRNPLYLANLLKIAGITIAAGDVLSGILIMLFYALEFVSLIRFEEDFLASRFPIQFNRYKKLVPVFFPTGRYLEEVKEPQWSIKDAIISERKTFMSTGIILSILAAKSLFNKRNV
ncbi:MAG: isoprenylcysteine carboxylmethyltransferase family protein [Candidatus Riflebacteria bacterium]|nr:isoprenylcysteine carboxylmethyltransferase family protein [Candidatus Riflebacteria bacterium]